jgi:hypothetical protein
LIIKNLILNTWATKIYDAIDHSVRKNHSVIDAESVQVIIDGSTRYLHDKANALSKTERPKTPEEMIEWVIATMRHVNVALEKANLNGFVYDASFQLHHKKPVVSPMQRDPKNRCLSPKGFSRYECGLIG